jgi:F-type H+-transporting ATPase subunit gamma
MASGQERILRRRIRSIQSTKKITRAMELIAASRIVRAQQRVAAARPYAEQITEVIRNLAAAGAAPASPLLQEREEVRRVGMVVVTADRGLAGAYNATVIRAAERAVADHRAAGREVRLACFGKKGFTYFRFRRYDVDASWIGHADNPRYEDAREIAEFVRERFEDGTYDRVDLAYTQFLSLGTQRAVVRQFVPLDRAMVERAAAAGPRADYEYEPSPQEILDRLLPRYAEARLFAALLESAASEHASRQRAMKSATDNAEELIVKLTRIMNRARQDAITTEIMEIVGGAEALAQQASDEEDLLPDLLVVRDIFPDRITERSA